MKQKIEKVLIHREKKKITEDNLTPSSVLIPLLYNEGQIHILFTKRTDEVNFHKGQVCFPGGTYQPHDSSLLQTALREADEEIGLKAKDVEILGELDDSTTYTTSYVISPFVAFIPYPYPFKLNHKEVEQIFLVPLPAIMDEDNFRQDYYPTGIKNGPGYAYECEEHIIWGATARVLKQFTELLHSESETHK